MPFFLLLVTGSAAVDYFSYIVIFNLYFHRGIIFNKNVFLINSQCSHIKMFALNIQQAPDTNANK